jgi:hypothetical protein
MPIVTAFSACNYKRCSIIDTRTSGCAANYRNTFRVLNSSRPSTQHRDPLKAVICRSASTSTTNTRFHSRQLHRERRPPLHTQNERHYCSRASARALHKSRCHTRQSVSAGAKSHQHQQHYRETRGRVQDTVTCTNTPQPTGQTEACSGGAQVSIQDAYALPDKCARGGDCRKPQG